MYNVHVLGAGAMGSLVAHELVSKHSINAILLFKNINRLKRYPDSSIKVNRAELDSIVSSVSPIEGASAYTWKKQPIENLIVLTKAFQTASALEPFIDCLSRDSKVLFLHNGVGVIDECMKKYPLLSSMPHIYKTIVTHGAYKSAPDTINHVGLGKMFISNIPRGKEIGRRDAPKFIQDILATPYLDATYLGYNEFLVKELEKLAVNACINPLTALYDCLNGQLLYGDTMVALMRRVLRELELVIRAEHQQFLAEVPQAAAVLNLESLLTSVMEVINTTRNNSSLMREDIRNLNFTEIDYINGYVSSLGFKHKIPTPSNNMLVLMVKSKLSIEKALDNEAAQIIV